MLFNDIGIVSRIDNEDALDLSLKIYKKLCNEGIRVVPEEDFARARGIKNSSLLSKMTPDLMITVGGDGTVLKTCMSMRKPETPILAINMGRRGYLTEVEPKKADQAIQKCLNGDYKIEEHDKLSVTHEGKRMADGLNEALIASMLTPEQFGVYYAVGAQKKTRGQAVFCEIDPAFRHDFFRIEEGIQRCVPLDDGMPKTSIYISVYRVLCLRGSLP